MPLDLYYFPPAPHCRSVVLTARALGLEINLKQTDLLQRAHKTAEFIKMNPQHTVPTLDDDGFFLWESRAIQIYLVEKYGQAGTTDSLYPADPSKRALVNQLLFFDMGTLAQCAADAVYPVMRGEPHDYGLIKRLEGALGYLDAFLAKSKWVASDQVTIADHSLACTASFIEAVAGVDLASFAHVRRWYAACKKTMQGWKEVNEDTAGLTVNMFNSFMRQNQDKIYDTI